MLKTLFYYFLKEAPTHDLQRKVGITGKEKELNNLPPVSVSQWSFWCAVQGRLLDGKVIDSSLSRDPLLVELGKRTVISGMIHG